MAEQETTSSMKTETKMVDQAQNTSASLLFDSSRSEDFGLLFGAQPPKCQCCNHKRRIASLVCIDCGNLLLCKECSRTVHNGSTHKRTGHQLQDLSSFSPEKKIHTNCVTTKASSDLIEFSDAVENTLKPEYLGQLSEGNSSRNVREPQSILLIDGQEKIQVESPDEFVDNLGCEPNVRCKVVSIFGNTGDGKSHTLNHTFFGGKDVFDTSESQTSCTVGVWAAYDRDHMALIIDTEGLLGVSENANKRMRLLLKLLAISDVVLYRTRAERLHSDMFTFLGDASEAYLKYFSKDLKSVQERCKIDLSLCNLGPAVIVFQETHYTQPLSEMEQQHNGMLVKSPEDILRENFVNVGRDPQAFSSISYIGTRTEKPPTDFAVLLKAVEAHLSNSSVRSARTLPVIYNAIMVLNDKFAGDIDEMIPNSFPDAYFTCSAKCQSCNARCECSMNHEREGITHSSSSRCKYQAQFDNRVFTCRICYEKGVESIVVPKTSSSGDSAWVGLAKYAWAGYVLECPECGVIYRSRQYWYGNREPVEIAVRVEIRHAWPGTRLVQSNENAARRLLDGMNSIAEKLGTVSAKPTKAVSNWVTDKVAPAYWIPNYQILACYSCGKDFGEFDKKHHCRACGQGFCDECTTHRIPVPERGWGEHPVRVCNACFEKSGQNHSGITTEVNLDMDDILEAIDDDPALETGTLVAVKSNNIPTQSAQETITTRRVTETVHSTLSYITSTLDYPREFVVDAARPSYWVPDSQITNCICCSTPFKPSQSKHHCRACGQGVCSECSQGRLPVQSRGWDYPVRVCKQCAQKKGPL